MSNAEEKEFDSVQFMRQTRDKISEDIMLLSAEERAQYFHNHNYSNTYLKQLKENAIQPDKSYINHS